MGDPVSPDFALRPDPAPKPARVREADILAQIRELLRSLRVPHWKNWGGPLGERGVPDIIGTLQGGRMLLIEVKGPQGIVSPEQGAFLGRHDAAGALAFVARSPHEVLGRLAAEGYGPAVAIQGQFVGSENGGDSGG